MPVTKVLNGQAWIDIALQELGTEQRLFELCDLNDAGITDDLTAGITANAPEVDPQLKRIVTTLRANKPCSTKVTSGEAEEGIEFWGIENDFIVS